MKNLLWVSLMISSLIVSACTADKISGIDTITEEEQATFELYFTDAPIDNNNIKSCFITVAEIKLDGKKLEGYNRTTVDILKYNNGETYFIDQFDVDAKTISSIELILDNQVAEGSDMPGCFIETFNGEIYPLNEERITVDLDANMNLESNMKSDIVIDFDLRKCVRETDDEAKYQFVNKNELESAIRLSDDNASVITGNCKELFSSSDKIFVYAYPKGQYDRTQEINSQSNNGIMFLNASNSTVCDENGDFELHFLNKGVYELHLMSYEENGDGSFELKGDLTLEIVGALDPLNLVLDASTTLNVNIITTGLLDL